MFCTDEAVNYILSYSKTLVDNMNKGKIVPKELKNIQYIVFAGLIAHYGFEHVDTIYKAFNSSDFIYTKDNFGNITKNIKIYGINPDDISKVGSFVTLGTVRRPDGKLQINRKIVITDINKEEAPDMFLEKVVHEINHVVNSINQPVVLYQGVTSHRIGMSVSEICGERGFGRILEESFNVLQTADIMNEIISFSQYNILDPEIKSSLDKIKYAYGKERTGYGYEFTAPLIRDLYNNRKFRNLVVSSRLNGLIKPIRIDFDSKVGEGCYYQFCDCLNSIDKNGRVWWHKSDDERLVEQYIKKYNAAR